MYFSVRIGAGLFHSSARVAGGKPFVGHTLNVGPRYIKQRNISQVPVMWADISSRDTKRWMRYVHHATASLIFDSVWRGIQALSAARWLAASTLIPASGWTSEQVSCPITQATWPCFLRIKYYSSQVLDQRDVANGFDCWRLRPSSNIPGNLSSGPKWAITMFPQHAPIIR